MFSCFKIQTYDDAEENYLYKREISKTIKKCKNIDKLNAEKREKAGLEPYNSVDAKYTIDSLENIYKKLDT